MPVFRPEEYMFPENIADAVKILDTHGDKARIIAGGTMVYELGQRGLIQKVQRLVDLRKLGLEHVNVSDDGIALGCSVVVNELAAKNVFEGLGYAVVQESLLECGPEQVKNVATVGGEICASTHLFDLPPALIAADAKLKIVGPKGERVIPIESFFLDYLLGDLRRGEFLKEVFVPRPPKGTGSCFLRYGRTALDYAVVSVAIRLTAESDGTCKQLRVGMGGMSNVPVRVRAAEKALEGKRIDDAAIASATATIEQFKPAGKLHASGIYRKHIGKILFRDGLNLAFDRGRRDSR